MKYFNKHSFKKNNYIQVSGFCTHINVIHIKNKNMKTTTAIEQLV